MNRPTVSVIIDTYNYGRFIEEAIRSVLNQDFSGRDLEILVIDDGSTDDTAKRVAKFAPRVKYIYKPNGGQASAFNLGFHHAKGDVVALLDADDYFLPSKLERIVKEFEDDPELGMVYHARIESHESTGEFHSPVFECTSGYLSGDKKKLFNYTFSPTSTLCFRRATVERLLPVPDSIRIQAECWFLLLMALTSKVKALDERLTTYRIHGNNLFYVEGKNADAESSQRRLAMFTTILDETTKWAEAHKAEVPWPESRMFLSLWRLRFVQQEFPFSPPSRLKFFLFLWKWNYWTSADRTWRLTLLNYATAVSSLFFDYEQKEAIAKCRRRIEVAAERMYFVTVGRFRRVSIQPDGLDR
jgi:glycosyltransferase involved in cell wall biosynthesis